MEKNINVEIGKYLSYLLRHHPEDLNLNMDNHGWVAVDELIEKVSKKYNIFNFDILENIVETNNKKRYSFNEDKTKIRANQGHSIHVDVELKEKMPPNCLFHGTASRFVQSINKSGLEAKNRLYVHLSADIDTAIMVGKRHGSPVVYKIDTKKMYEDGFKFYISENNVWLTKHVPPKYLKLIE